MFDFEMPSLEWRPAQLPKKNGGIRHIVIPNDDLRKTQRNILQYLYALKKAKLIDIASFAHGFVPYKNTGTSIKKHSIESEVFLCCDIKNFFDTFPMTPVKTKLLAAGLSERMVDKILAACTYNNTFPQGAPTSPYLTNIGMKDVDLMLSSYADKNGFVYTRYADDITFSLKPGMPVVREMITIGTGEERREVLNRNPYKKIFMGIDKLLRETLGLRLNRRKNHIVLRKGRKKPIILGITLRQDNKGYSADKKLRLNTRAAIHKLAMKVRKQRGRPMPEDHAEWARIYGTINYMDYVRSLSPDPAVATTADPVIQEKHFKYLEARMKRQRK